MIIDESLTVLIPNYNGSKYLEQAIKSVIAQNLHCDILVVDNNSTDDSLEILARLMKNLPQLQVLHEANTGIANALNKGLDKIETRYTARLDADDIMVPMRLNEQIKVFRQNPQLVLVGSNLELIDEVGNFVDFRKYPVSNFQIKASLNFRNPIAHPSVLYLTSAVKLAGGYNPKFNGVEDLELWLRLKKFGEFRNIDKPLTLYRLHPNQFTQSNNLYPIEQFVRTIQLKSALKHFALLRVLIIVLRKIDLSLMTKSISAHRKLFFYLGKFVKKFCIDI